MTLMPKIEFKEFLYFEINEIHLQARNIVKYEWCVPVRQLRPEDSPHPDNEII